MAQILDKEVFGLDPPEGATTTDDNEESEISIASGASIKSSKKRKRNRRRKNKSRPVSDNENLSRVASNERISSISQESPVVVTTYVCSSSELDKVRKLIDDNENVPSTACSTLEDDPPTIPEEEDESRCENETRDDNDSIEVVYHPSSTIGSENQEEDLSKIDDSGIEELSENPDQELQMEEDTAQILKSAGIYNPCKPSEEETNVAQDDAKEECAPRIVADEPIVSTDDCQIRTEMKLSELEDLPADVDDLLNFRTIQPLEEMDTKAECDSLSQASSISKKSSKSDAYQSSKGSRQKSLKSDTSNKSKLSETSKASRKSGMSENLSVKSVSQKTHTSQGSKRASSEKSVALDKSSASAGSETLKKAGQKENSIELSEKSASSKRSSKKCLSKVLEDDQMQMSPISASGNSHVSVSHSESEKSSKKCSSKALEEGQMQISPKSVSRNSHVSLSHSKSEKSNRSEHSQHSAISEGRKNEILNSTVEKDNEVETEDEVDEIEDLSIRSTKTIQDNCDHGASPIADLPDAHSENLHSDVEAPIDNDLSELRTEINNSEKSKISQHSQSPHNSEKSSGSKKSASKESPPAPDFTTDQSEVFDKTEDVEYNKNEGKSQAETCSPNDIQRSELVVLDALGVLNSNDFPNLQQQDSADCGDSSSANENDDECSANDQSHISVSRASIKSIESQKSAHSGCSKASRKSCSSRKSDCINEIENAVQHQEQLELEDESQASKNSEKSHSVKSEGSRGSVRSANKIVSRESVRIDLVKSVPDDESQGSQSLSNASSKSGVSKSSRRSNKSSKSVSSKKSSAEADQAGQDKPLQSLLENDIFLENDNSLQTTVLEIPAENFPPHDEDENSERVNDLSQKSDTSQKSFSSSKSASIKQSLSQASKHSRKSNSSTKSNTSRKSAVAFSRDEKHENQSSQSSEAFSIKSNASKSSKKSQKLANATDVDVEDDISGVSASSKQSSKSSKKSELIESVDILNEDELSDQVSVPSASSGSSPKSSKKSTSSGIKPGEADSERDDILSEKSKKSEGSLKSMASEKSVASAKDSAKEEHCLSETSQRSDLSLKSQTSTKSKLAEAFEDEEHLVLSEKKSDHDASNKSCKIILDGKENLIQVKEYTAILTSQNNKHMSASPWDKDPTESDHDSQSTELSEKTAVIYDEEDEDTPVLEGLQNTPGNFSPVNQETYIKHDKDTFLQIISKASSLEQDEAEVNTEDEADDINDISIKSDENFPKAFSTHCNQLNEDNLHITVSGQQENLQVPDESIMATESNPNKLDKIFDVTSDKEQVNEVYANVPSNPEFRHSVNFCKGSAFYCPATLEPFSDFALDPEPETTQDDAQLSSIPDDVSETSVYSLSNEPSSHSAASKKSNHSRASKVSNHSGVSKASNHSGTSSKASNHSGASKVSNHAGASKVSNHSGASKSSNHSSTSKFSKSSKRSTSSRISRSGRISGSEFSEQIEELAEKEIICKEKATDDVPFPAEEIQEPESQSIPLVQRPSTGVSSDFNDQLNKSSIDLIFKTKTVSGNPSSFFTERALETELLANANNEILESVPQREDTSVRIEGTDSTQIQHPVDESCWLSDADNEGREQSVPELGCSEIKLIKTDDIVLNDSMANNNYLQIHDPREEIEAIADKLQSRWYESQGIPQLDLNPRAQPLAETELSLPEESAVTSSTTLLLPQVPFPSVENYEDVSLNPPSPQLHPSSLARIALIKREDPELVAFAQDTVRNVISQARDKVISLENDCQPKTPEASAEESESEVSKPLSDPDGNNLSHNNYQNEQEINSTDIEMMQENYQDSEPDPCTVSNSGYENPEESTAAYFDYDFQTVDQPSMRLVLSSNKATTANLSASSSNASIDSSTEALLRLPQVPNPSVANPDGLQNSSPPINLTGLRRWVGDICSTKEMQDAFCDGKQNLELEPTEMLDKQSVSGVPSVSYSANYSETYDFPDVPDDEIDVEDVEPLEADVSEQESEEEKRKPKEEKMLKELFRDDSSLMHEMEATSIPQPPHWVIDPKVIEDAITESDMTEDREPEKTSFIQSIFNCFGKKHRSKKSKEDCNVYMTPDNPQQQKTSGRATSRTCTTPCMQSASLTELNNSIFVGAFVVFKFQFYILEKTTIETRLPTKHGFWVDDYTRRAVEIDCVILFQRSPT
ncbi:unnamed protein product [Allacma fusca]|uniref:Uncharacterized protein n=1 Tax=Allacma fusca TaxID=39272 RepID=A0A8J2L9N1_9HEXA|nr:unnamed protein product [Allacma fusca]